MKKLLLENINKVHITKMGTERIKRNICIDNIDVVEWCKEKILDKNARINRKGKNWYVKIKGYIITVNASSYTIITVHKEK